MLSAKFQLTRLMRGVTEMLYLSDMTIIFQLTRLMRGVTTYPRTDSQYLTISTHTPHARRDFLAFCNYIIYPLFQLTRLMRGVTVKLNVNGR